VRFGFEGFGNQLKPKSLEISLTHLCLSVCLIEVDNRAQHAAKNCTTELIAGLGKADIKI